MKFSKIDFSKSQIKEYRIHGCRRPSEKELSPQIYASTIFAVNSVVARSLFFKLLTKQYKIKATHGEVLRIEEIKQDDDFVVKNYRISFVYRTRTGFQNAYKEIRHINKVLAISALNQEFGSRHKVKHSDIYIISIDKISAEEATKPKCITYSAEEVKFPIFKKIPNTKQDFVAVDAQIFN
ncbi:ribosomal prt L18A [Nucleospora cyclopteri]